MHQLSGKILTSYLFNIGLIILIHNNNNMLIEGTIFTSLNRRSDGRLLTLSPSEPTLILLRKIVHKSISHNSLKLRKAGFWVIKESRIIKCHFKQISIFINSHYLSYSQCILKHSWDGVDEIEI